MRIKLGRGLWHRRVALLLLSALLLVALVPRGYMPDADALRRGQVALTLCRVATQTPGTADAALSPQDHPCPFGLLPTWQAPPAPPAIADRLEMQAKVLVIPGGAQATRTVPGGGLGARGPPVG